MNPNTQQQLDESVLDRLVEQICDRIQAGEMVRLDSLIAQYPDMADRLRDLYPTLLAMANWNQLESQDALMVGDASEQNNKQSIGDFRIIHQIGRGGMGIVYEAEQLSIQRRVALKILPLAALVDSRALQRFRNEVAAVATLEHPHVVPVYAVGEERGIHYYAMKLIRGQSLAAVIGELRARADRNEQLSGEAIQQAVEQTGTGPFCAQHSPSRAGKMDLSPFSEPVARGRSSTVRRVGDATYFQNVARLIQQAAEGLQHAHDHGIIHRDIKPGNLLLDAQGSLFVTDFGLARIETGAGVTMTGDVLGTLRYMSPEQVLGNRVVIDHRTDIYSLGATLYELLTLQPMWTGDDKVELIRQISNDEPLSPRKVNASIPNDLETIVLKAISKAPGDRYASAQTIADDLQCHLDHKPILAKRPTLVQRFNKWTHRHPTVAWATSLLMLVVTVGSAVSASLIWSANNETEQALTQSNKNFIEAQRQTDRAEQNLDRVLKAVDDLLIRVGESNLANIPGTEQLRKQLFDDAQAICESFIDEQAEDPRVQLRSAEAQLSLGTIQSQMGDDEAADQAFAIAVADSEAWIMKHKDHELVDRGQENLAGAYLNWGNLYLQLAKYEQALAMFQTALDLGEERSSKIGRSENRKIRLLLGIGYRNFATALMSLNRNSEAETACRKAIESLSSLVKQFPEDPEYRVKLAGALQGLGATFNNRQDRKNAVSNYEEAIQILREWSDKSTDVPWAKSTLAGILQDCGVLIGTDPKTLQLDHAELLLNESISIFRALAEQFPNTPGFRASLTSAYLQLAGLYRERARNPESINLLEQAIMIQRSLVDDFPTRPDYRADLSNLLNDFGGMLNLTGQHKLSMKARLEATDHCETLVRNYPEIVDYRFFLAKNYFNLGNELESSGQAQNAEAVYQKALPIGKQLVAEFPDVVRYRSQLVDCYSAMGGILLTLDEFETAAEQLQFGLKEIEHVISADPDSLEFEEQLISIQSRLAAVKSHLGQLEEGERLFKDNIARWGKLIERKPSNPIYRLNYAICHGNLAFTYKTTDRHLLAAEHFEKALHVVQELVQNYPNAQVKGEIAKYYIKLIEIFADIGDSEKATATLREAAPSITQYVNEHPDNQQLLGSLSDIGDSARKLGLAEEGRELLKHCADVGVSGIGVDNPLTQRILNQLGRAHQDLLEWQDANECFGQIIEVGSKIRLADPSNVENSVTLGGALCNRGNGLVATDNFDAAIDDYTTAIQILQSVDDPQGVAPSFLSNSYQGRAEAHHKASRFVEALADFDSAMKLTSHDQRKSELQLERSKALAQQGNYLDAVNLAETILQNSDADHLLYPAAAVFALAAGMAQENKAIGEPQRQQEFTAYCNRAFELLELARRANYFNSESAVNDFLQNPEWSAIRNDQRYQDFVKSIGESLTPTTSEGS